MAALPLDNPWDAKLWPHTLPPELEDILGRPNFTFCQLANLYREAGHGIARKAEAEQAFFIHRMVGHWFANGDDWGHGMAKELDMLIAIVKAQQDGFVEPT